MKAQAALLNGEIKTARFVASGTFALLAWILVYSNIEEASKLLVYGLLTFPQENRFGSALQFFLFEVPKVLLLLILIVYVVGVIRTFFTPARTRKLLTGRRELVGNVLAAHLGIVTPFCSCSAIPLFIGFVESGVPLGVTFSFLIAAPMINEIAVVLLFGMFGWKVALTYIVSGLLIAIGAGFAIGKLGMERYVEDWVKAVHGLAGDVEAEQTWPSRLKAGTEAVKEIVSKVWLYVVFWIAVGAGIHGYVPTGFMASFMGEANIWAVPAAVILGVPMYSNAAGIIPIVHALLEKGAALGTALAFMMAVIGLSLPEVIILRKVLKPQLIATFVLVVSLGIIATGYLFNWIL